jgi:choice-of-anchor A domain-containing protein
LAAGGNVTISGYSVGCKVYPPPQGSNCVPYGSVTCPQIAEDGNWPATVAAGDSIFASGGEIKLGNVACKNAYVADSTIKYGAECTAFYGDLIDFAYWQQYLQALSTKLKGLTVTGVAEAKWSGYWLTGTNNHHMEVFNVRGADLCNPTTTYFQMTNVDNYATIIINVDGDNLNCGHMGLTGVIPENVVWNFHAARSLTFESVMWQGSVLAVYADIVNPTGNLVGQVFANSWTSTGSTCMQQNWVPFQGCISTCYWRKSDAMCTYSPASWGQNTGAAASALTADFDTCLPVGISVGCGRNTLYLSSKATAKAFLSTSATGSGVLDNAYVDVTTTPAGDF